MQFTTAGTHLVCLAGCEKNGRRLAVAVNGTMTGDFLFPAASVLIPNIPTTFHAVAVMGEWSAADDADDGAVQNAQYVRLEINALGRHAPNPQMPLPKPPPGGATQPSLFPR